MRNLFCILILALITEGVTTAQVVTPLSISASPGSYRLDYSSTTVTDLSGLGDSTTTQSLRQTTQVSFRGRVTIDSLNSVQLRFLFDSCSISYNVNSIEQTTLCERIAAELTLPCICQYDNHGVMQSVQCPTTWSAESIALSSAVMATLQFTHVASAESANQADSERVANGSTSTHSTFSTIENDRSGTARMSYRITGNGRTSTVEKTRHAYIADRQAQKCGEESQPQSMLCRGAQLSVLDSTGHVSSCIGNDTLKFRLGSTTIALSRSAYTWSRVSKHHITTSSLTLDSSAFKRFSLPIVATEEQRSDAGYRSLLGSSTLSGLLDSLDNGNWLDSSITRSLPNKLRAAAHLVEGMIDSLSVRARSYDSRDPRFLVILDVFSDQSSASAQSMALQLLYAHRRSPMSFAGFVSTLSAMPSPGSEIIDSLLQLSWNDSSGTVRNAALMCLGSLVRTLSESDSTRATNLLQRIIDRVDSCNPIAAIHALGNSGLGAGIRAMRHLVATSIDKDSTLEEHFIGALMSIPGEQADSSICAALHASSSLRQCALQTLLYRPRSATIQTHLLLLIQHDCSPENRADVFHIFHRWLLSDQSLYTALRAEMGTLYLSCEEQRLVADPFVD